MNDGAMEDRVVDLLSAIQVRVLGCLIEKRRTTPEQYPLTLNALCNACNQKSARDPVTRYSQGEVGHALRELESRNLVREVWGSRVHRYEHTVEKTWDLKSKGMALLCVLMLRGPQTLGELKSNSQRLYAFDDLDDVRYDLNRLMEREPPMVAALPRGPGQKEGRYGHLLCGTPQTDTSRAKSDPEHSGENVRPVTPSQSAAASESAEMQRLRERVQELESGLENLKARFDELEGRLIQRR